MGTLAEQLKTYWESIGVKTGGGTPLETIKEFEAKYGVRFPEDLRDYLLLVNGMAEGGWDEQMVEWYGLQRWETLSEAGWAPDYRYELKSYFLFADYCLHGFSYAILLSSNPAEPTPVICATGDIHVLAPTFGELLRAYLADPSTIYP